MQDLAGAGPTSKPLVRVALVSVLFLAGVVGAWFWFIRPSPPYESTTTFQEPAISVLADVVSDDIPLDTIADVVPRGILLDSTTGVDGVTLLPEEQEQLPAQRSAISEEMYTGPATPEVSPVRSDVNPSAGRMAQTEGRDAREGALTILCLPSCEVRVNGEPRGQASPALSLTLPVGQYPLALVNEEFPPYELQVDIDPGQQDTLRVPLLTTVGSLELAVSPWGHVYVDSTYYGVFPPNKPLLLAPGDYTVQVNHPELGWRDVPISIGAGESVRQTVNLTESTP